MQDIQSDPDRGGQAITCDCGQCRIALEGAPILTAECHCASCRAAAEAFAADGHDPRAPTGGTPYVLYRKDRIRLEGAGGLSASRLSPAASTRRVRAGCCGAPMFLEFEKGHWLSLYAARWPDGAAPEMELRTMCRDRAAEAPPLPSDIPNAKGHTARFMVKLLGAWAAMGFRAPKLDIAEAPRPGG